MRYWLALFLFLAPASCVPAGDGMRTVFACRTGDPTACAPRSLHEQAVLDANAIMMGMQASSARAAARQQGRAP
jgi:hypothetical protein